jgi:hypothetical protein
MFEEALRAASPGPMARRASRLTHLGIQWRLREFSVFPELIELGHFSAVRFIAKETARAGVTIALSDPEPIPTLIAGEQFSQGGENRIEMGDFVPTRDGDIRS